MNKKISKTKMLKAQKIYVKEIIAKASSLELELIWIPKIMKNQTVEEVYTGQTTEVNEMGLSGYDAPFITSVYDQIQEGNHLTNKQKEAVSKILQKYWKQYLVDISIPPEKIRQIIDSINLEEKIKRTAKKEGRSTSARSIQKEMETISKIEKPFDKYYNPKTKKTSPKIIPPKEPVKVDIPYNKRFLNERNAEGISKHIEKITRQYVKENQIRRDRKTYMVIENFEDESEYFEDEVGKLEITIEFSMRASLSEAEDMFYNLIDSIKESYPKLEVKYTVDHTSGGEFEIALILTNEETYRME